MMIKYRLHEVAKDFDIQSKELVEVLKKYTGETKKSQTALEENELDILFDVIRSYKISVVLIIYVVGSIEVDALAAQAQTHGDTEERGILRIEIQIVA